MSKSHSGSRLGRTAGMLVVALIVFAACEEETAPGPVPTAVEIVAGDGQYSKQGTELQYPVVVRVTLSDGAPGAGVLVRFAVLSGGGTLSRAGATTNGRGESSVRWTLGGTLGTQQIRVTVEGVTPAAVAQATAADYYCPEEDPTFVRRFTPQFDLFLFTRASSVTASGGPARAGVVQLGLDTGNLEFDAGSIVNFDESVIQAVVRDCAFSASGEFYIAWVSPSAGREIAKIAQDRSVTHFATLEGIIGTEITWLENGVLAGCDEFGPFTVGCRDTLTRYPDASFSGTLPDVANWDAVAYDSGGNYLYFIDQPARRLKRVPLDGYTQTGPTEEVVTLTADEAAGANGMVVYNGAVFIQVESTNTKAIVRVPSVAVKETVFNFFSRGAGDAAGIQDDLALDPRGFLYTLDTLNNVILLYQISADQLFELGPDAGTDAFAASNGSAGERVGLAILP